MAGFDYAFIDLNPALAKLIVDRHAIFNQVKAQFPESAESLDGLKFWDNSAMFLRSLPDGTLVPKCDAGGDFDETELTYEDLESYGERTDCNRMVITDDAVYWTAYPHHCDRSLTVETVYLDWETVKKGG